MTLATGDRLGPYEIIAPLGAGGMGEVYKARDTRLDRAVAIKVLPSAVASDPQFRERFDREARAISQLDHPHICSLHDVGEHDGTAFLVMQYLEGETLEQRLKKGALPLDQALQYAIQIAGALDKAHRAGIVHRDLKPGNIMLTKDGAKLLDFGVAKLLATESALGSAPTVLATGRALTGQGTILGTFQYMAPEQLEGSEPDARIDIFAFGTIVYEMSTGRRAFEAKTQASLITAIMSSEPLPMATLQPMTSPALDHVVKKCLAKRPDDRWQSAGDLASELRWIVEAGSQPGPAVPIAAGSRRRERRGWIVAAVLLIPLVGALVLAVPHLREVPEPRPIVRLFMEPPQKMTFRWFDGPVVSPDGQRVVFTGLAPDGRDLLWVRALDAVVAQPLPATEGARFPFWSPDSRFVGFFAAGKLKKIEVAGGLPQTICDTASTIGAGGSWSREGIIVFASGFDTPLSYVTAAGGEPRVFIALDQSRREVAHRWPSVLPDGHHVLYVAFSGLNVLGPPIGTVAPSVLAPMQRRPISLASFGSNQPRLLVPTESAVKYASGHLLYVRGSTLMAQAFDVTALRATSDPVPVAEGLIPGQYPLFSVSDDGVLAYRTGSYAAISRLVWLDRSGKELSSIGEPASYSNPAISPDDRRVAVGRIDPETGTRDIWLFDETRRSTSRLTFDPAEDLNPAWSADGKRIVFTSGRKGMRDIYQKMATGSGEDEPLLVTGDQSKNVNDWSPDGRFIVYDTQGPQAALWILPLVDQRKPFPFVQTKFDTRSAQFSPNGRWIAYSSSESGRYEVYVRAFPASGGSWQVSTAGGTEPTWRRDGKELVFVADRTMMAVDVKTDSSAFDAAVPKGLFQTRLIAGTPRNRYAVTSDGQRFLINMPVEDMSSAPFTIVLNWQSALGVRGRQ